MHRVRAFLVCLTLAASVSACGSGDSQGSAAETPTVTATDSASPAPSTTTPAPSDSGASSPPVTAPPSITGDVVHTDQIASPTQNIHCSLSYGVECVITQASYDTVPRPADCELDWSDHWFSIGRQSGVRGRCAGDTPLSPSPTLLAYGATAVANGLACQSQTSGMTCWNRKTRHGFQISRASYHLF